MGRIEDAAEALKQQQTKAELESERRRREAEEDLVEFVQIMRTKGIKPERAYQRSVESRGIHSRTSRPTSIISFDESAVRGWVIKFSFRGEYDDHEWFATLVTPNLALWKARAFKRTPMGGPVEYPSLQPGQLTVSKAFPGGALSELVVVVDEPLPDHLRQYELNELPRMARTYLDSLS
ncbi:hypothetical protein FBY31_0592 [Arthrobacter sp. SLBN-100]|uniref:hypothetical protein n=1 Tax=Arthrobacter sp. SLBN-100 TaxID=2768450 RepID=UPI00115049A4|nr:hypothetical protein [Arthrobacter sp. SLBN-100]TQJ66558.1 hypothetical protein FBY31_0592 [Arthrobacter sp. SLBN-100]